MTTQAFYDLATGVINSTLSPGITDTNQIAALASKGIGVLMIPDDANGASGIISGGVYVAYAAPSPVPNITNQLVAALINNGTVDINSFHPATVAQVNAQLSAANMTLAASPDLTSKMATPVTP